MGPARRSQRGLQGVESHIRRHSMMLLSNGVCQRPQLMFGVQQRSSTMKFNTMKIAGVTVVAFVIFASSGAAFAGSSPFCYGGSPTPKHVCDTIKANQKPKPVVAGASFRAHGSNGVGINSRAFGR